MLSDKSIASLVRSHHMIHPFYIESISHVNELPVTSFGSSSYGYDLSLGPTFRRMRTKQELSDLGWSLDGQYSKILVMDPSNFNPDFYGPIETIPDSGLILMPGEFILSVSHEHIQMPSNVSAICMQKSTCARAHLRVEVTPLEAGWTGYVTYEITNPTSHPILLHKGQGITQAIFFEGDDQCDTTYLDRGGKYQNQPQEPVIPRSKHKQSVGYPYLHLVNGELKLANFCTEPACAVTTVCDVETSTESFDKELSREELATKLPLCWRNSVCEDVSIDEAIAVIAKAVHADQSYAWGWICNLAMIAQDNGVSNAQSNKSAANFMYNLFKYRAWATNEVYKEHIKDRREASYDDEQLTIHAKLNSSDPKPLASLHETIKHDKELLQFPQQAVDSINTTEEKQKSEPVALSLYQEVTLPYANADVALQQLSTLMRGSDD